MGRTEVKGVTEVEEVKEKVLRGASASGDGLGWYDQIGVVPPFFGERVRKALRAQKIDVLRKIEECASD